MGQYSDDEVTRLRTEIERLRASDKRMSDLLDANEEKYANLLARMDGAVAENAVLKKKLDALIGTRQGCFLAVSHALMCPVLASLSYRRYNVRRTGRLIRCDGGIQRNQADEWRLRDGRHE